MQKLELEKRRAVAAPTAENVCGGAPSAGPAGDISPPGPPVPSPGGHGSGGGSSSGGLDAGHAKAALRAEAVAAERREAELRSQALLRVRLAAEKRVVAAAAGAEAGTPARASHSDSPENAAVGAVECGGDRRVSQDLEDALRSRLRARKG